jgi:hypothetical protein
MATAAVPGPKAGALSLADEEQIIKNRFMTQASVARGEPPLKRLTKRRVASALDVTRCARPIDTIIRAQVHFVVRGS